MPPTFTTAVRRSSFAGAALALGLFGSACVSGEDELRDDDEAIVGGSGTSIASHPWQVYLRSRFGSSSPYCGGSIVHESWILTANHCVEGDSASSIAIVAGVSRVSQASSGQTRTVSQIIQYPGYYDPSYGKDVALLELSSPLTFGTNVAAIDLVSASDAAAGMTDPGVNAEVTGWGTLSSGGSQPDQLQEVTVPIVSLSAASSAYNESLTSDQLPAGRLGVGGVDSCQGDSGGPLTVSDGNGGRKLAGVVSWGYGCAEAQYPGIYARVSSFESWVATYVPQSSGGGGSGGGGGTGGGTGTTCGSGVQSATGLPVSIPDNNSSGTSASVSISETGSVQSVSVTVSIDHTYRGDLIVAVESPSGTQVVLSNRSGGSADDYSYSGTISGFSGESAAGTWRLVVSDRAAQDTGTIDTFSVEVTTDCADDGSGGGSGGGTGGGGGTTTDWSGSSSPSLSIVDNTTVCDDITISGSGDASDVELSLSGTHSWRSILEVTLAHGGATVEVVSTGDWSRGSGSFSLSNEAVSGFSGSATGTWTLCVTDTDAYNDSGTLSTWSIGN